MPEQASQDAPAALSDTERISRTPSSGWGPAVWLVPHLGTVVYVIVGIT